jgi:hypothetical protein
MPYDKDLRDLIRATKKASQSIHETIEQHRKATRHEQRESQGSDAGEQPQATS